MSLAVTLKIWELLNTVKVEYECTLFIQSQFYYMIWDGALYIYLYYVVMSL